MDRNVFQKRDDSQRSDKRAARAEEQQAERLLFNLFAASAENISGLIVAGRLAANRGRADG